MKTFTETLQDLATNASTTRDRAIVRARVVQKEIDRLHEKICAPHSSNYTAAYAALLASYDRELTRLCQIPGVLSALLAEMVIEETTP